MLHILGDTKKLAAKNELILPHHHVINVISVISCSVMSHHFWII